MMLRPGMQWHCSASVRGLSSGATFSAQPIEESALPPYSYQRYYSAHLGERLAHRYKVITKLGFDAHSTVWLARDERYINQAGLACGKQRQQSLILLAGSTSTQQ